MTDEKWEKRYAPVDDEQLREALTADIQLHLQEVMARAARIMDYIEADTLPTERIQHEVYAARDKVVDMQNMLNGVYNLYRKRHFLNSDPD